MRDFFTKRRTILLLLFFVTCCVLFFLHFHFVYRYVSNKGPGGPILILTSPDPTNGYYEEIIRTEGLNLYKVKDVLSLDAKAIKHYDVIILGEMELTQTQVDVLTEWVNNGGSLVAMRPDKKLSKLLGLEDKNETLSEGYLLIDTKTQPGAGLVNETIQYHGKANIYDVKDAQVIATLYKNATTPINAPAVTLRRVGNSGGKAAAFTFDLAKSIIATRQGNIEWAGKKQTGKRPLRPNELFSSNFLDMNKVAIPQADEQQRLLANLIILMNENNKPLPRFWYLPGGRKVVILHSLDDHNNKGTGTKQTFDMLKKFSSKDCSVADWECFRATSWIYVGIPLTEKEALDYSKEGFEIGVHVNTHCFDWDSFSLNAYFSADFKKFRKAYPLLPPQRTERIHCIVWSDWSTAPKIEYSYGVRLDTNYYYWPAKWIQGRPGFFTGSGIPMRYTDVDGSMIDVYQAATQLVNENGLHYPEAIVTMVNKALGPEGYYGILTTHDDFRNSKFLEDVINVALEKKIAIVSADQVLTWLDGRNNSSFSQLSWFDDGLGFYITVGKGARNLQTMLPMESNSLRLQNITHDGKNVDFEIETRKGISYALFKGLEGYYKAFYK